MSKIPNSVRVWFLIHFLVDIFFAVPLIFAPIWFMSVFGLEVTETLSIRLVGAALAGIGGVSFWSHGADFSAFQSLLRLKILWSLSALLAIGLYIFNGGHGVAWLFFTIFLLFSVIWNYYYIVHFQQKNRR
jgi:hypothetical protein